MIQDTLYSNKTYLPKIHSIRENEIKEESESSSFKAEQSPVRTFSPSVNSLSVCRPPLVKKYYSSSLKTWLPFSLHPSMIGIQPPQVDEIHHGSSNSVDIRPHIFDPVRNEFILCDSGSQVSAWPPDPGDSQDPNLLLKAANGSKMACYGFKNVNIKIGHKEYQFKIIKAQVETPILGWDFMDKYKLDLRWNENDELTIYDKSDKSATKLHFKPIAAETSVKLKNLSVISSDAGNQWDELVNPEVIAGEVAAIQALAEDEAIGHDEDINVLPDDEY